MNEYLIGYAPDLSSQCVHVDELWQGHEYNIPEEALIRIDSGIFLSVEHGNVFYDISLWPRHDDMSVIRFTDMHNVGLLKITAFRYTAPTRYDESWSLLPHELVYESPQYRIGYDIASPSLKSILGRTHYRCGMDLVRSRHIILNDRLLLDAAITNEMLSDIERDLGYDEPLWVFGLYRFTASR